MIEELGNEFNSKLVLIPMKTGIYTENFMEWMNSKLNDLHEALSKSIFKPDYSHVEARKEAVQNHIEYNRNFMSNVILTADNINDCFRSQ